jgi:hypothetical protein
MTVFVLALSDLRYATNVELFSFRIIFVINSKQPLLSWIFRNYALF